MPERDVAFTIDDPGKIAEFIKTEVPFCHMDFLDLNKIKRLKIVAPTKLPLDFPSGPHYLSNLLQLVATGTSFNAMDSKHIAKSEIHNAHCTRSMLKQHGSGAETVQCGSTMMGPGHGLDNFLASLISSNTAWLAVQVYDSELNGDILILYRSRDTSPLLAYPTVKAWFDISDTRIRYQEFCDQLPTPRR